MPPSTKRSVCRQKKRNAQSEAAIQVELKKTVKRIAEIDTLFAKDFPDYAALANPEPLDVKAVQAQLKDDEVLVYFVPIP